MAQAKLAESKLRLVFEAGMDSSGSPIYKTKTFNNIKKEATADQIIQVANSLSVLCTNPLSRVERADSSEILA